MTEEENNERASALTIQVAKETLAARQQAHGGTLTSLALSIGSALRSTSRHGAIGMIAGSLLEQIPTALDASSGVLDVTGIDTILYLDDSASMNGSNLNEGYKALSSLEERLKAHDDESRFLPTRIVKFGDHPQVLAPSDEHWSAMLVSAAWDASAGGTYM